MKIVSTKSTLLESSIRVLIQTKITNQKLFRQKSKFLEVLFLSNSDILLFCFDDIFILKMLDDVA